MKRNAVAVAVGALFIAPAAQAQIVMGNDTIGTVQFYGKLYPQVIRATSSGATETGASVSTLASPTTGLCGTTAATGACNGTTAGSRLAVDSQNSYLGFRGERKFGNTGLKGIWQIEQSVELDTGTGTFSNRNSFLGLAGGFGTVKLGNMDTIYKEYGQVEEIFGLTSGNFISPSNVLSQIGIGNSSTASFHLRVPNSIQYQTPEFQGFQAGLQYSPDETKNDVPSTGLNKELWSMGVKWESGPLYLSAQYERHKDFFGGSTNIPGLSNIGATDAHSKDTAMRFSAAYKLGNHRIAGDIARLKYEESGQVAAPSKFVSYEHTNWAISFESSWGGPWRTAIEYVSGGEGTCKVTIGDCSTTGLKGALIGGGVAYDLDKQTFLYALAAQLKNDPSAIYSNWKGSKPARGADITQIALGMAYRF
jgi:predicted porin